MLHFPASKGLLSVLICVFVFTGYHAFSATGTDRPEANTYELHQKRSFSSLDAGLFKEEKEARPFFMEAYAAPVSPDDLAMRNKIEKTLNKVVAENRFVDYLDENALVDLPIGLKKDMGALSYIILIDSLLLTPNETFLYASMSFEAPSVGKIHFRGTDIRFSKSGGLVDGGRLELVGDYPISLPGGKSQLVIRGDERKTFVEFDCNGFKQMSLDASVLFSRDLLRPVDENGEVVPEKNVALDFTTVLMDWNDLLVVASIPDFEVKGLDKVIFNVDEAVLDLSDLQNVPGIVFPQGYAQTSPYLQSGSPELWRGVFIRSLTVTLPPQFEQKTEAGSGATSGKTANRITFAGANMLIDNLGFSGTLAARNLIPIERGKIGNWSYSLDEINISLRANSIVSGGFKGLIDIPISSRSGGQSAAQESKSRLFGYSAQIKPGNEYIFNVSNPEQIDFSLWGAADVTLAPSSWVEIRLANKKFLPKAHLSGKMSIGVGLDSKDGTAESDEKKNVSIADITFQDLEIQTVKPYVKIGAFSLGTSSSKMGGFSLMVNKIEGGQSGDDIYLGLDVTIALTGDGKDAGSFGAGGGFRIISEAVERGDDLSYRFKEIELNRFSIDIDKGAFKFAGNLNFFKEDPVYGNGVSGTIDATFTKSIKVRASAVFGSVDGVKYWYVDALADLGNTVPIFTGVYMNQFGGGAYYHMKIDDQGVGSPLGKTVSGMVYVPDRTMGLGLKAMVGIKGEDEKLFNANATFEMAFRSGGGLRYINFRGNAYLMSDPVPVSNEQLAQQAKKLAGAAKGGGDINQNASVANGILGSPDTKGAAIYAGILINYDFDNRTLHANLDVVINVAAGMVTGGGNAVMHFSPEEWYIYIGRPEYENRFNLNFLGLARADAYFVMGSVVPDTPPPPSEVSKILGGKNLDYMGNLNALADGAGIGFGASLRIDTGDKSFLIFYGRFQAGLGFDVMLKDYGSATCKGRGKLGVNGWYANGQAYAYFDGKIGVKVKLFRKTKSVDILSIGAAVILQAKLPNPFWARGIVGGYYRVLGGLVKGNCSFEVVIGEECEMENYNSSSALDGIEVIAQLTPENGTREVDVFSSPQAVFNYEMEKAYQTRGLENEQITFRIGLDAFRVKGPQGALDADLVWNADKTVAILEFPEILPSETEIKLEVVTSFQEFKNGRWETVKSDGEELKEARSVSFTTGKAPDDIPAHNIAYTYPTKNMLNFYKGEHGKGYVKLKAGQGYLFEDPAFASVARFTAGGQELETSISYNSSSKEVAFDIPSDLPNDKILQLTLVNVPRLQTNMEANVTSSERTVSQGGVDATVRTRSATGTVKNYEEKLIYEAHFRTSRYNTLAAKMKSILFGGYKVYDSPGVHFIGSNFNTPEAFSREELYGVDGGRPMIRMVADLTNNSWYNNEIEPLIYTRYGLSLTRDISIYGRVPARAVSNTQYPYNYALEESAISSGYLAAATESGRIDYRLAIIMNQDLKDLQIQAANSGYFTPKINKLLTSGFPAIRKGDYWIDINYHLPGRDAPVSTYKHKIVNQFD